MMHSSSHIDVLLTNSNDLWCSTIFASSYSSSRMTTNTTHLSPPQQYTHRWCKMWSSTTTSTNVWCTRDFQWSLWYNQIIVEFCETTAHDEHHPPINKTIVFANNIRWWMATAATTQLLHHILPVKTEENNPCENTWNVSILWHKIAASLLGCWCW